MNNYLFSINHKEFLGVYFEPILLFIGCLNRCQNLDAVKCKIVSRFCELQHDKNKLNMVFIIRAFKDRRLKNSKRCEY